METLLEQRRLWIYSTTVSLKDPAHISVRERAGFSVTEQTLPLDAIDPNPMKVQSMRFGWAIASIFMALITGAFVYGSFQPDGVNLGSLAVGAMFGFLTALAIAKAIGEFRSVYVYTDAQTHRFLFAIHSRSPSAAAVTAFIEQLGRHITALRYPEGLSGQQRTDHYKRHVQFLLDEGVLTPAEHAAIAARLDKRGKPGEVVKLFNDDV